LTECFGSDTEPVWLALLDVIKKSLSGNAPVRWLNPKQTKKYLQQVAALLRLESAMLKKPEKVELQLSVLSVTAQISSTMVGIGMTTDMFEKLSALPNSEEKTTMLRDYLDDTSKLISYFWYCRFIDILWFISEEMTPDSFYKRCVAATTLSRTESHILAYGHFAVSVRSFGRILMGSTSYIFSRLTNASSTARTFSLPRKTASTSWENNLTSATRYRQWTTFFALCRSTV
jgi:hypothetical protein